MGAFYFFVVRRFPFQGTKGSEEEKRQNEINPKRYEIIFGINGSKPSGKFY